MYTVRVTWVYSCFSAVHKFTQCKSHVHMNFCSHREWSCHFPKYWPALLNQPNTNTWSFCTTIHLLISVFLLHVLAANNDLQEVSYIICNSVHLWCSSSVMTGSHNVNTLRTGHLNCLNACSRGLNHVNQLLYCVSLKIYNKFANYFCELKFSGNTHQRP